MGRIVLPIIHVACLVFRFVSPHTLPCRWVPEQHGSVVLRRLSCRVLLPELRQPHSGGLSPLQLLSHWWVVCVVGTLLLCSPVWGKEELLFCAPVRYELLILMECTFGGKKFLQRVLSLSVWFMAGTSLNFSSLCFDVTEFGGFIHSGTSWYQDPDSCTMQRERGRKFIHFEATAPLRGVRVGDTPPHKS